MQNSRFFCRSVISRSVKSFFKNIFNPLPDTKKDHHSDNKGDYWAHDQIFCLEYMSDNRDRRPIVLFSEKKKEMNANVPESRKLRNCWAQTVFLFLSPRWHVNLLSKVHQSMQKHHTELVNKTGPHLSKVTSPLLRDWGWKLDRMKKWSLFWLHFEAFFIAFIFLNDYNIYYIDT